MNITAPQIDTPTPPPHPAAAIAASLDLILAPLLLLVAAQFRILGDLTVPLWTRLSRARQRLVRLLAQLAAGHMPRASTARPGAKGGPRPAQLSRRHAWVITRLGYNAAGFASQLNHLLLQPGVAELLATSPGAARTLRPLCRMLGIDLPAALRRPEPPHKPHSPKPRPPVPPPGLRPATPDRPLPAYVRAASRAWGRRFPKIA